MGYAAGQGADDLQLSDLLQIFLAGHAVLPGLFHHLADPVDGFGQDGRVQGQSQVVVGTEAKGGQEQFGVEFRRQYDEGGQGIALGVVSDRSGREGSDQAGRLGLLYHTASGCGPRWQYRVPGGGDN
jgi:hypothetical protein